jgi:hypothetical protein
MDTLRRLMMSGAVAVASGKRPAPVPHAAIAPPFDPNDEHGLVHTTLPPEQIIPPHFTDPLFMRADFNGVCLAGEYSPTASDDIVAAGGITMTSGRWTGLRVPFLPGANTTPPNMIMTPMLVMYPQDVIDAALTEHAERGYDDLIFGPEPWNAEANLAEAAAYARGPIIRSARYPRVRTLRPGSRRSRAFQLSTDGPSQHKTYSPQQMLEWCRYVKSWGFRVVLWRGDPNRGIDPMFETLMQGGVVDFYGHGTEVDEVTIKETYEASLDQIDRYIGGRIPISAHFTADADRKMGYPIGFPRNTYLNDWGPWNGRVHLLQQLAVDASAGLQGSSMWYARKHINCGIGDAVTPGTHGAPDSRIIAFETMAFAQLYGKCDENDGNLRDWELLCGTRDDLTCARPVSGFGNGCRYPNGDPI